MRQAERGARASRYHVDEDPFRPSDERTARWDGELPQGWSPRGRVVAMGVFDGLHLGHRFLFEAALEDAERRGCPVCVLTFDRDPDEFFRNVGRQAGRAGRFKLMRNADRVAALYLHLLARRPQVPFDVIMLPCGPALFEMPAAEFLERLGALLGPCALHVGEGFRFGARAQGTTEELAAWCGARGAACNVHGLFEALGAPVSSSRIRGLLAEGSVEQAQELLGGRAHSVWGHVVHGRGEGTGFGFATANLDLRGACRGVMLPAEGVYACWCSHGNATYPAAVNVGAAKSFEAAEAEVEAHLLGFEGDLYDAEIEVSFVHRLRGQRVFEDVDELIATVERDISWVRENLGSEPLWHE